MLSAYPYSQRSVSLLAGIYDNFTSDGRRLRDLVCCACGDMCGAGCGCGSADCAFGCSPYDNYPAGSQAARSECFVQDWPLASNGQPYIAPVQNACPSTYSWQFDDAAALQYCSQAGEVRVMCWWGQQALVCGEG